MEGLIEDGDQGQGAGSGPTGRGIFLGVVPGVSPRALT